MIGRQRMQVPPSVLLAELRRFGFSTGIDAVRDLYKESAGFADAFFRFLGAQDIQSMDASAYQNASLIHDLNLPIPSKYKEQYSVVYDGGTLEHIFGFPTALGNCMSMVSIGGHILGVSPLNNYVGHGFYQFSPELFFRILSVENGFQIKVLLLSEFESSRWYRVEDPRTSSSRNRFRNCVPTLLFYCAQRLRDVEPGRNPQQSDYSVRWDNASMSSVPTKISKPAPDHALKQLGFRIRVFLFRLYYTLQAITRWRFHHFSLRRVDLPMRW
jgi:hypothetical protein